MSTEKKQSAIDEVRDQLSLDFADGVYLNLITANMGLTRPRAGFTDDIWRAIARAIALNFKQIRSKFEEILAVVFGPKTTIDTSLTVDALIDATSIFVADTSDWPQQGTLILDEGQVSEETIGYCYINKFNNQIFLRGPLTLDHTAIIDDAERALMAFDGVGEDKLIVSGIGFPNPFPFVPYTIVVGPGTASEEIAVVASVNPTSRELTLVSPLSNAHEPVVPSSIKSNLAIDYDPTTFILVVENARQFPETGNVLLGLSANQYPATGGTLGTIVVAGGTFLADAHAGDFIVFNDDTTTAVLRGVQAQVISNTDSTIVLDRELGAAAVAGDTFKFRATVGYTSVELENNVLVLDKAISDISLLSDGVLVSDTVAAAPPSTTTDIELTTGGLTPGEHRGRRVEINGEPTTIFSHTAGTLIVNPPLAAAPLAGVIVEIKFETSVEVFENRTLVEVAQVKSTGTGWDVIQTENKTVEVLIPDSLREKRSPRNSSYLHTTYADPAPATTLAVLGTAGDAAIEVSDPTTFPIVGVVTISPGAGAEENVAYFNPESILTDNIIAFDTVSTTLLSSPTVVELETGGLTPNEHIGLRVIIGTERTRIVSHDANTLIVDPPLDGFPPAGLPIQIRSVGNGVVLVGSIAVGATAIEVLDSSVFPAAGDIILGVGDASEETVTISANDLASNVLTISATVNEHFLGELIKDVRFLIPNSTLVNSHAILVDVILYQPRHGITDLLDGNLWLLEDVWPGPYVYDRTRAAPNIGAARTTVGGLFSGPAIVALDQLSGQGALELSNASAFPLAGFPYNVSIGANTGNPETLIALDLNLKQRTRTTTTGAPVGKALPITAIVDTAGPGIPGANFPLTGPYRILLDKGGASEEVVYVLSVSPVGPTMILENAPILVHGAAETVEFMADILSAVATIEPHEGVVDRVSRSTFNGGGTARWPETSSLDITTAELAAVPYDEIFLTSTAGFPTNGAKVYLNFGTVRSSVETSLVNATLIGDTVIEVPDSSVLPVAILVPPKPFVLVIDPGTLNEEIVRVAETDVPAINELTLETALRTAHPINTPIEFIASEEQLLSYDSVDGNNLRFSPPIVLQFTHSPGESAIVSIVDSEPKDNGYDFPFTLPPDIEFRLRAVLDLVRAAGVDVVFIDKR